MKHLKPKVILALFFFGVLFNSNAQSTDPVQIKIPKPTFSLGFGSTMPSSTAKDAFVTNSSGVNADLSIPLAILRNGLNGTTGATSIGINVGGQYNFSGNGDPSTALPSGFVIGEQTSSFVAYKGADPRSSSFRMGAGPQINFNLGDKFTVSPMVLGEYFSMTQKELSAVQTTEYNGQTLEYNLFTLPETKTSGFAITPKIRLEYMLTKSLGLFADGSYILGPKTEIQLSTLVPEGKADAAGQYNQRQLDLGTQVIGEPKSSSYSAMGFNVGLSFVFGGVAESANANINTSRSNIKQQVAVNNDGSADENGNTEAANANINTSRSNIKQQVATNNDGNSNGEDVFTVTHIKKESREIQNCVKIISPSNGSNQNIDEPLKILLNNENSSKSKNVAIKIYKISNDKNFWNNSENQKELLQNNNSLYMSTTFEKEAKETGFNPISISAKQRGSNLESSLEKGKLSEGAYKMVVISDCGVTTTNFMISSSALTTISLSTNCKEKFGDYSYIFAVKNTGTSSINITSIPPFTSSTGVISSFTFSPALPLVLAAGATQNFTGSFTYSGTYTGDVYATVSGHQVGNINLTSQDTEMGELKSCICDFCDRTADFDSNKTPNATYNVSGNSLSIHQEWWDVNPATGATIVGAKAEIISFSREVSDDCMKCDKDSSQWGNFISGNSGTSNGSFGSATGSVTGNTHHTLYFANPNKFSFDTNISIPPISTLKCCCEKYRIKIRYTYIFRDKDGQCKMCSEVFEYYFQKGLCPIVIDHGTGVLIKGSNIKK